LTIKLNRMYFPSDNDIANAQREYIDRCNQLVKINVVISSMCTAPNQSAAILRFRLKKRLESIVRINALRSFLARIVNDTQATQNILTQIGIQTSNSGFKISLPVPQNPKTCHNTL